MANEDGAAKMARLNLQDGQGGGEKITKVARKERHVNFKDFTLNEKSFFSVCTDEELNEVLSSKQSLSTSSSPHEPASGEEKTKCETENGAPTFKTAGDARLDFFFHVMEQTDTEQTVNRLEKSWNQHPLHTLKLIAILRDIRDGKGIRSQYHDCLYWLYQNHPKTLYENLSELLKFGYWKDCLQLLVVISFDGFVHPYLKCDDVGKGPTPEITPRGRGRQGRVGLKRKSNKRSKFINFNEKEIYNVMIAKKFGHKETGSKYISTQKMTELRLRFAREKFLNDTKYRVFHIKIAQLFAQQLLEDISNMKTVGPDGKVTKETKEVSLAGKWAPSLEAHFDRYTLIASTIAVELTKMQSEAKFDILTKPIPIAVYLSRKNYNKEFYGPLRKFHDVPEVAMSAGEWDKVNYKRVPSKCMKRNRKFFSEHDLERFGEFLKKPESKVAGAALKPVEIITQAMQMDNRTTEEEKLVMEKQWASLVEDIKKKGGLLKNALAICDVSGSMSGDPMLAAVGLTLITMSMSNEPWNSLCITFDENPAMHNLDENLSLIEKIRSLKTMEWGGSTNLQKSFELVLSMGLQNQLTQEQMPKVLLIFTDMEFDSAFPGTTLTNFEAAKQQFKENGYELPAIVFWNLRSAPEKCSTPVQVNEYGAILLAGYSAQQLSYVMQQDDLSKCSPLQFVLDMIEKDKYSNLKIY